MSDLKYRSVEDLREQKVQCEASIASLRSRLNGQMVRLEWIEKYIFEKTPQELSIQEIEQRLGHAVIIKQEG